MLSFWISITLLSASKASEEQVPTKKVFFGDLHVHTHLSLDAGVQGTKTTPMEAYAFAKGQTIRPYGRKSFELQLGRPLDFAELLLERSHFGSRAKSGP